MEKLSDYYAPPMITPRLKKCVRCKQSAPAYSIQGLCPDCHEEWITLRDQIYADWLKEERETN